MYSKVQMPHFIVTLDKKFSIKDFFSKCGQIRIFLLSNILGATYIQQNKYFNQNQSLTSLKRQCVLLNHRNCKFFPVALQTNVTSSPSSTKHERGCSIISGTKVNQNVKWKKEKRKAKQIKNDCCNIIKWSCKN